MADKDSLLLPENRDHVCESREREVDYWDTADLPARRNGAAIKAHDCDSRPACFTLGLIIAIDTSGPWFV
jgi:hypothetical protein